MLANYLHGYQLSDKPRANSNIRTQDEPSQKLELAVWLQDSLLVNVCNGMNDVSFQLVLFDLFCICIEYFWFLYLQKLKSSALLGGPLSVTHTY